MGIVACLVLGLGIGIAGMMTVGGCQSPRERLAGVADGELIDKVAQGDQADSRRLLVMAELAGRSLSEKDRERLFGVLTSVVVSRRHSPAIRERVVEWLLEHYPRRSVSAMGRGLMVTVEPGIRQRMIGYLSQQGQDPCALGWLIRALPEQPLASECVCGSSFMGPASRAGQGDGGVDTVAKDRSVIEAAIETATGAAPGQACVERLMETDSLLVGLASIRCTGRAWGTERLTAELMARLAERRVAAAESSDGSGAFLGTFSGTSSDTFPDTEQPLVREGRRADRGEISGFLGVVGFWAERFGYVPSNVPRFLACHLLMLQREAGELAELSETVGRLEERWEYCFDVRDSYLLVNMGDRAVSADRAPLERAIAARLAVLSHTARSASYDGAVDDYDERFDSQSRCLSVTDLFRIRLVLETLAIAEHRREIGRLLQKDAEREDTEVGGLCFLSGELAGRETVAFREYPAGRHESDRRYVESPAMTQDGVWSLARWHCHADRWQGGQLAGPGMDDMAYAEYVNSPVIIITYLTRNRYNADYLSAQGVVVDLGNYDY